MKSNAPVLSILQVTDMHIMPNPGEKFLGVDTDWTFNVTLEQAFAENQVIDVILVTGDLTQYPSESGYQRILTTLSAYHTPSLCLPGNHDDFGLMKAILNSGDISCRKQLLLNNWQIICLDSQIPGDPGGRLAAAELTFLEDCLKKNPDKSTLIAVHHHCKKINSAWMDTMMIDNSGELFAILKHYPKVKAITCGHIHQEMDIYAESIRLLGSPSTCFQFTPKSPAFSIDDAAPGYRLLELYADGRLETRIKRLTKKLTGLKITGNGY